MPGKPIANKGMKCPLYKQDVSRVCHKCELYQPVKVRDPQGEGIIDEWGCSIKWSVTLGLLNAQMERQTAASIQSFRNTMVTLHNVSLDEIGAGDEHLVGKQLPAPPDVKKVEHPRLALAPPGRKNGVTVRLSDHRKVLA